MPIAIDHESLEPIAEVAGVEILNTPSNDYPTESSSLTH